MKIGGNIGYLAKHIGMEHAARLFRAAGLTHLDYTAGASPEAREKAASHLALFEENGLVLYQTHAPFNRYQKIDPEQHKKAVFSALDFTSEVGARFMVVHGDEFDFDSRTYSFRAALDYNYEYFAPVVEAAARRGVRVAFENVFEEGFGKPRFCSTAEELSALVDRFGCDDVCACWDFGHGAVSYKEKQGLAIRDMGRRIACTHVHDNYFSQDTHLVPYFGKIDWDGCIRTLAAGSAAEVLSLELVYGNVLSSFAESFSQMLGEIGASLAAIARS